MKRLSIAVALLGGAGAWASPICQTASLADYIALGAEGCVLQDPSVTFTSPVMFGGFEFTPVSGVSASAAAGITVIPIVYPYDPGLTFIPRSVSDGESVAENISFTATALPVSSAWLSVQGASGFGTALVTATACSSGVCFPLGGNPAALPLGPVDSLTITDELRLRSLEPGDIAQIAYLQNLIARPGGYGYCDCAIAAGDSLPEAPSLPLVVAGMSVFVLLGIWNGGRA